MDKRTEDFMRSAYNELGLLDFNMVTGGWGEDEHGEYLSLPYTFENFVSSQIGQAVINAFQKLEVKSGNGQSDQ